MMGEGFGINPTEGGGFPVAGKVDNVFQQNMQLV